MDFLFILFFCFLSSSSSLLIYLVIFLKFNQLEVEIIKIETWVNFDFINAGTIIMVDGKQELGEFMGTNISILELIVSNSTNFIFLFLWQKKQKNGYQSQIGLIFHHRHSRRSCSSL